MFATAWQRHIAGIFENYLYVNEHGAAHAPPRQRLERIEDGGVESLRLLHQRFRPPALGDAGAQRQTRRELSAPLPGGGHGDSAVVSADNLRADVQTQAQSISTGGHRMSPK